MPFHIQAKKIWQLQVSSLPSFNSCEGRYFAFPCSCFLPESMSGEVIWGGRVGGMNFCEAKVFEADIGESDAKNGL